MPSSRTEFQVVRIPRLPHLEQGEGVALHGAAQEPNIEDLDVEVGPREAPSASTYSPVP